MTLEELEKRIDELALNHAEGHDEDVKAEALPLPYSGLAHALRFVNFSPLVFFPRTHHSS